MGLVDPCHSLGELGVKCCWEPRIRAGCTARKSPMPVRTREPFTYYFFSLLKVHYHIIPAPQPGVPIDRSKYRTPEPPTEKEMHTMELEGRAELDEDFAKELTDKIRRELSPAGLSHL